LALSAGTATARADITATWVNVPISAAARTADPVLNNMQCFSLRVTTDGDWGAAGFRATLPAGMTFYHTPPARIGQDTHPNPAFFAVFPDLEFDTYVSSPRNQNGANPPLIVGGFPPGQSQSMGGNSDAQPGTISVLWGDAYATPGPGPGSYEIARLTFPTFTVPSIDQLSFTTQFNPTSSASTIGFPGPYEIKRWLPDVDGDWNVAGNWSGTGLPTLRQRVLLDVGGASVRTITHASGNTELHELRSFERIVLSGGTLSTYVTEINGELLVSGGTFRPLGVNHLTGSGAVTVAPGGTVAGGVLVVSSGATLRGTGGSVATPYLINNPGGRILAEGAGDVLPIHAATYLQGGETGGAGAVRVTGTVQVNGNSAKTGGGVLRANGTFTIAGTNTLDLRGGALVHDYTGTSSLSDVHAKIISGYNNNTWTGTGIKSTTAAADDNLAIGYAEASALFTTFPATFMGESIDNTTLLVRLVRNGDADLSGTVGLDDFNRLAASFGSSGALWDDGDFNYDGIVNLNDFNLLAANFGLSAAGQRVSPGDWAALGSAVPESGVTGLIVLCGTITVARRHRRG
jgi:predicted outer membrane repeat protein